MTNLPIPAGQVEVTPLAALELVCGDIYARWDADQRSGKLLTALSGMMSPGYDARVDLIRSALASTPDTRSADVPVDESAIIDIINLVTDLDAADALDKAVPEVTRHVEAIIARLPKPQPPQTADTDAMPLAGVRALRDWQARLRSIMAEIDAYYDDQIVTHALRRQIADLDVEAEAFRAEAVGYDREGPR